MSVPVFAVVGHPNKGKSSIVATLAMDDSVRIGPEPGTTHRCRRYPMRLDDEELYALVDTPGFQRARRALQWMRQHETTADRHEEIVRAFVETHRNSDRFPDECELLYRPCCRRAIPKSPAMEPLSFSVHQAFLRDVQLLSLICLP